jgi:hypothetical protein
MSEWIRDYFERGYLQRWGLGVRPSNRRDIHIPSCCAPTMSITALGDGRVGVPFAIASDERIARSVRHKGDTA